MTEIKLPVLDKIARGAVDYGLEFYLAKIEEAKANGEIINHNSLYIRGLGETLREFWSQYISNYDDITKEINKSIMEHKD